MPRSFSRLGCRELQTSSTATAERWRLRLRRLSSAVSGHGAETTTLNVVVPAIAATIVVARVVVPYLFLFLVGGRHLSLRGTERALRAIERIEARRRRPPRDGRGAADTIG
jgi:hypothetical protein